MKILIASLALFTAAAPPAEPGATPAPAGSADGGTAAAEGPDVSKMVFTPETIKQIVSAQQPKIQQCYEDTLANKSKPVEGRLMTSWTITPEGMVKHAKIEKKGTTIKDPKLYECVVAVLSVMQFPKPPSKKNTPIQYPFKLTAIR